VEKIVPYRNDKNTTLKETKLLET